MVNYFNDGNGYRPYLPKPKEAWGSGVGDNPPYTSAEFLVAFPQFAEADCGQVDFYIGLCNTLLQHRRWQSLWEYAMGLGVAHFLTLATQAGRSGNPAAGGGAMGLRTSKSVGDVSVSYDYSTMDGYHDWGSWLLTSYGQQLATLGKTVGMGGMLVW